MNTATHPAMNLPMAAVQGQVPATPLGTKLLWGSVALLGVAVLAMGATLVNLQSQGRVPGGLQPATARIDVPALLAAAPPAAGATASVDSAAAAATPAVAQVPPTIIINNHITPERSAAAPARAAPQLQRVQSAAAPAAVPAAITSPAPAAPQVVAQAPAPVAAPVVYSGYPAQAPAQPTQPSQLPAVYPPVAQSPPAPVCANCGTVESVTPIQRSVSTGGTGAVAGGVLGAVVGNQIGKGSGRALGTIIGAIGGGLAGNAIEKQMKKETVYQVGLRMDNGSLRSIEQSSAPAIGSRMNLDNAAVNTGQASSTAPANRPASPGAVTVATERT